MKLLMRCSLMGAAVLWGCAAEVTEPVGSTSEGLDLVFVTPPAPPKNEDKQPPCWWTNPGESCELECVPEPGGSGGPTFGFRAQSARASHARMARLAGSRGSSSSTSRLFPDLDLQTPWCPDPTGDGLCATCSRPESKWFRDWLLVTQDVGSKMLITNGGKYDGFVVGDFAGREDLTGTGLEANEWVDLAAGIHPDDRPVVSFNRDVYIQFTLENESGIYPAGGWNKCSRGGTCQQVESPPTSP